MSVRKIIIGVGIVAVVGYYLLGNKIKRIVEQFQNVKVYPVAFKKFDVKWNMLINGKAVMKSQEMLDSIFIGILPLAFTLICFWLIAKKNVSINKMIIGVIVFGILASFLGIA